MTPARCLAAALLATALLPVAAATPAARAADAAFPAPAGTSDGWQVEFGARAFFSGGRYQKTLSGAGLPAQINSRLTYGGTSATTGELFGRLDAPSGWFVKGYAGIGSHGGGILNDEDFPPDTVPYSSTNSRMRNGRLDYASLDVGALVFRSASARIGLFAGVHHFKEKYHGYGCEQVAGNPTICGVPYPPDMLVLSETGRWTSLRLGVVGDFALTERLTLTAEAAFLPYTRLAAFDNHWLRSDINLMAENGQGIGAQFEASLAYRLTDKLSLGAGGRFWYLATTSAKTQFPLPGIPASALGFRSERWGAFVQAAYRAPF